MCALSTVIAISRKFHGIAVTASHSPEGCRKHRIDMACGGWQNELREIVGVLTDAVSLESCSFLKAAEMEQADSKMLEEDEHLAEILHKFIVALLAFRILYDSILQYGLPWAAAQLLTICDTLKKHLKTWHQFYQDFVQLGKGLRLKLGVGRGEGLKVEHKEPISEPPSNKNRLLELLNQDCASVIGKPPPSVNKHGGLDARSVPPPPSFDDEDDVVIVG